MNDQPSNRTPRCRPASSWAGLAAALLAACSPSHGGKPPRTVLSRLTVPVAAHRLGTQDTPGLHASLIRASPSGIWLADLRANRVALLGYDGVLRWTTGRTAAGPDEFGSIRDIRAVGDARLAVLDSRADRVTVLDDSGTVVSVVPLPALGHPEQLIPLADTGLIFVRLRPDTPLVWIDYQGRIRGHVAVPWSRFAELPALAAQLTIGGGGGGRGAALVFRARVLLGRGALPMHGRPAVVGPAALPHMCGP